MNDLIVSNNTQVVSNEIQTDFKELFDCNTDSIMLNEIEQNAIVVNFNCELYIFAAEIVWRRTIDVLRERLSFFGEEFLGDMLGYDKPISVDKLSEKETIDLNYAVGFLRADAKMELLHHSEQIKQYTSRHYQMVEKLMISKPQAMTLVDDCIRYVLADMTECTMLEFNSIRNKLKTELFTSETEYVKQLKLGQYFEKRTILRSLINLARTDKEEDKQKVFHNMSVIIPEIWHDLSETDRYSFGTTYAEISSTERKDYVNTIKTILYNVHGFDYVPENLKSNSFIATAKNLLNVHDAMNNFYNEPLAAKLLASMGTMIPDPAIFECINATIICITGNDYGISDDAQQYLIKILDGMTVPKWTVFLKDISKNSTLLYQLGYVGIRNNPAERWCEIVKNRNLNRIVLGEPWINEFLSASAYDEVEKIKNMARVKYNDIM